MTLARLSAALGLGADADAVVRRVRQVYAEVDAEVAARADGVELPCKAGCDACCHESVFVCAPEFLAVAAELVEAHPLEGRRSIVEEMRVLAARFEDELELLETIPPGSERDEVAARVKFRCPLLTNSGRCSVYASRELNGRTFGLAWHGKRAHPFGCELTHERLRVLPPEVGPSLYDAVAARRRLADAFPALDFVHVFPWWFDRYGDELL